MEGALSNCNYSNPPPCIIDTRIIFNLLFAVVILIITSRHLLCSLLEKCSTCSKFCLNKIIIACIINCGYINFIHARSVWGKDYLLFIIIYMYISHTLSRDHFTLIKKKLDIGLCSDT